MISTTYRDLVAWQKGIDLCELIYRVSAAFPRQELYGLTGQIRRAALSVPSNIAEGAGRITTGEFLQAVGYARGSLLEIETQFIIATRLGYLGSKDSEALLETTTEVGKLINGLMRSLKRHLRHKSANPPTGTSTDN
jgi:four helix bundle protein